MKKNLLPLLGIAFAVALLATVLFYGLFLSKTPAGGPAAAGRVVVVAARNLDRGTTLAPSDVRVIPWGSPTEIKGAYTAPDQIAGLSLVQPLLENEPITESRVASRKSGAGAGAGIPSGMRAVSVHVTDSTGVVAMLRPGQKVDIQVVGSRLRGSEDIRLKTMLQNMEVLGINPQFDSSSGKSGGQVLTLLATPGEADLLGLADSAARLRVILRNPLDEQRRQAPVLAQPALFEGGATPGPAPVGRADSREAPGSRITFQVQMAAADPAALKELSSYLERPLKANGLEVLPFRRGSDVEGAVRSLHARDLLDLLPPANLTARHRGEVSVHNGMDGGDACQVSIRLRPSIQGDAGLRLRVQPEIVSSRSGATRGIDTELDLRDGQSLLVTGLADAREKAVLLKRLFPARSPERVNWELVVLVTPQAIKPLQTAALGPGR